MTRFRTFIVLILLVGSIPACKITKDRHSFKSIELERNGCYGTCPIYEFKITPEGKGTFKGERFTDKMGHWEKEFEEPELRPILDIIRNQDWSLFSDEYPSSASDLPSTEIRVNYSDMSKQIFIQGDHPEELAQVVQMLILLAESPGWTELNTD